MELRQIFAGLSKQYDRPFFKKMEKETGIKLENIVYYQGTNIYAEPKILSHIFPEMKLRGLVPNFFERLYIPTIGPRQTDPGNT